MEYRVGFGYDVHKLVQGRRLILGAVEIPYELGLLGHSDADCLLHAICDAILGAAALGDIGRHFPDTDPKYKGVSSLRLLKGVRDMVNDLGWGINNVDSTIVAQAPKLSPFIQDMRTNIANCLGIDVDRIGVKATTTEGLGFTGMGQGIACYSVVSLLRA